MNKKIIMTLERLRVLSETFPLMTVMDLYDLVLLNKN